MSYFDDDGKCPLCSTAWEDENRTRVCDHEANWYRQWLAEATQRIDQYQSERPVGE